VGFLVDVLTFALAGATLGYVAHETLAPTVGPTTVFSKPTDPTSKPEAAPAPTAAPGTPAAPTAAPQSQAPDIANPVAPPIPVAPPVPPTADEQARNIANKLRKDFVGDLSKKGRSGSPVGAQLDVKVGAELVRQANKVVDKALKEAMKALGKRLQDRGRSGRHK